MALLQSPLTYEGILELFRQTDRKIQELAEQVKETSEQMKETDRQIKETDRQVKETSEQMKETDRQMKETDRQMKETDRKLSRLGSRIGELVENMVKGNIVEKFQAFGYEVTQYSRNKLFNYKKLGIRGEIDLFLEDGDIAILIEVKTTFETADVRAHIERIEKYRRYTEATSGDKRRFIGVIAGAVVTEEAEAFAHQNGMYVIEQSGNAVEILKPPKGFIVKKW